MGEGSETAEPNAYRIEAVTGGYEAQMLYQPGGMRTDDLRWFPLNAAGFWSDPDAFPFGLTTRRDVFATQAEAASAIRAARIINGDPP